MQKKKGKSNRQTLALTLQPFFCGKNKGKHCKRRSFFSCGTPKILGKGRQNAPKKEGKSENKKKEQGVEGQGRCLYVFANFSPIFWIWGFFFPAAGRRGRHTKARILGVVVFSHLSKYICHHRWSENCRSLVSPNRLCLCNLVMGISC